MKKISRFLLPLAAITLPLPLIFLKKFSVHYPSLGIRTYYQPRAELFVIPLIFLCLFLAIKLWEVEN